MTAEVTTHTSLAGKLVVQVPVSEIHEHPSNSKVRRSKGDLNAGGLLDSVREHGIMVPLELYKLVDGAGYRVHFGHRRLACAVELGHETVPAYFVEAGPEAEELARMVIENDARQDLSPMERATAYQAILELGPSQAKAAKMLGVGETYLRKHLHLTALPPRAQDLVHDHQMTLDQAGAMYELRDFRDAAQQLTEVAGSGDFAYTLRNLQRDKAEADTIAKLTEEIEAKGVHCLGAWTNAYQETMGEKGRELSDLRGPKGGVIREKDHEKCPHRAVFIIYSRSFYADQESTYHLREVCLDYEAAGHTLYDPPKYDDAADKKRRREQQAKERKEEADRAAQAAVRRDFVTGLKIPGQLQTQILRLYLLHQLPSYLGAHENYSSLTTTREDLQHLADIFGVEIPMPHNPTGRPSQAQRDRELKAMRDSFPLFRPKIEKATGAVLSKALLSVLMHSYEHEFQDRWGYGSGSPEALVYAGFLRETGYEFSTAEQAKIEKHEARQKAEQERDRRDAEARAKEEAAAGEAPAAADDPEAKAHAEMMALDAAIKARAAEDEAAQVVGRLEAEDDDEDGDEEEDDEVS